MASRQVEASMSPSCLSCPFLLDMQVLLIPHCRPARLRANVVPGHFFQRCEHFRSCLRMLVDCEARLCALLMQSFWDLLQSWGTLGWEYEHSETDPGHRLAKRKGMTRLWRSRRGTVMVTVTSRCDMLCSLATLGSVSLAGMVDNVSGCGSSYFQESAPRRC